MRRTWLVDALRSARMTQAELARALDVTPRTVRRWVAGHTALYRRHQEILASLLDLDVAGLETGRRGAVDMRHGSLTIADEWTEDQARRIAAAAAGDGGVEITPETAPSLVHEWLVVEPPQTVELDAGRRIGADLVERVAHRAGQLRRLDDFVAGSDLEAAVNRELAATSRLVRQASYTDPVGRRLLGVLGDLCQLAGWAAADAGRHRRACHYYATGIGAAHAAGDRPLAGQLSSTLAYHLTNAGHPRDGVLLGHSALAGSRSSTTATTKALFLERLAWAHARNGDERATERTLLAVEDAYARRDPDGDPSWAYWLTPEEVDVMAGRCYVELHHPERARFRLERALSHYGEDRPREAALYGSWLAEAHAQTGDIDAAAEAAVRVLDLTTRTASVRSDDRARHLHQLLRPHRNVPVVNDFHEQYRALALTPSQMRGASPASWST